MQAILSQSEPSARYRFRRAYYAFMLLAVAGPLLAIVAIATWRNHHAIVSIQREHSLVAANQLAAQVNRDLDRVARSLRSLSQDSAIAATASGPASTSGPLSTAATRRIVAELRTFIAQQPLLARIRLVDGAGEVLADTRPGKSSLEASELLFLEYMQRERSEIDSAVSSHVVDDAPSLLFAERVRNQRPGPTAPDMYLLASIAPNLIADALNAAHRQSTLANVYLADANGKKILAAAPDANDSDDSSDASAAPAVPAATVRSTIPIGDSTWHMVVALPAAALHASTWRLGLLLLAVGLVAGSVVAASAWWVSRFAARRVDELTVANSEREIAQRRAESANRAKCEFLANMSHEVRTPLNGILGFTELLIRGADNGNESERQEFLRTIRDSGRQLLNLINDILDISKIESGFFRVECARHSPDEVLSHVIAAHRVAAAQKKLSLDYRWESRIPESIQTDPQRLNQLLSNLVANAIKFTERGGVLLIARLDDGDDGKSKLVFEVRDSGPGIPADKLDAIFEPFTQCDTSITRRHGGTGLGLAICRKIAESLGGYLTVSSIFGRGTTFTAAVDTGDLYNVRMAEMPMQPIVADVPQEPSRRASLQGLDILVVDDMETNRRLVSLFLTRAGANVESAENGALGIEAVNNGNFHVVLMDMQMPVMDGYTAASLLRDQGFQRPIIALTAHAMRGDREKCELAGCSHFVAKPVNMDELIATVKSAAEACPLHDKPPNDQEAATLPFPGSQATA